MKKLIGILMAVVFLSSCGKQIKDISKSEKNDKSVTTIVDKTVTEINKVIDTNIKVPGVKLTGVLNLDDSCTDDSIGVVSTTVVDTPTGTKLTVSYDKGKKQVKAQVDKPDTTVKASLKVSIKKSADVTTTKQNDVEEKTENKNIERKGTAPNWTVIISIAVVIIFACLLLYLWLRRK